MSLGRVYSIKPVSVDKLDGANRKPDVADAEAATIAASTERDCGWLPGSWLAWLWLPAATVAFLSIVAWMHLGLEATTRWRTPLSLLRDGSAAAKAQSAFGLLLVIHVLLLTAAWRARDRFALFTFAGVGGLLGIVALTPSDSILHLTAAILGLSLAFSYYAFVLQRLAHCWFWLHLVMPVALAVAAWWLDPHPFEAFLVPTTTGAVWVPPVYGIWQKAMLAYLLLLANIHALQLHTRRRKRPEFARVD